MTLMITLLNCRPAERVIKRLNKLGNPSLPPYKVAVELNGKTVEMEVDTGAAVSLISESTKRKLFPATQLSKSPVALCTYSLEPITVLGQLPVEVKYNDYVGTHTLFVVKGNGSNLLGRDWLQEIRLDWASIKAIALGWPVATEELITEYAGVFAPGAGTTRHVQAELQLKEGAQPRFFRPRTVPYVLREKVGKELDRLEEAGVLRSVTHSDWAAPIVPVVKKDDRSGYVETIRLPLTQPSLLTNTLCQSLLT